jgi:hypothetical protein
MRVMRGQALVLAIVFIVVGALPAAAERSSRADPHSDGFVGGEITRLSASNRTAEVSVRVKFKNLIRRDMGASSFAVIDTHRRDNTDYMIFTRWNGSRYVNRLLRTVPFSDAGADKIRCPRMSIQWQLRKDRILMHVPQACLKRPSQGVRVGFYSNGRGGSHDDWAPGRYATYGEWLSIN